MTMISSIRSRMAKHAQYRRTLNELYSMTEADMRDLNMDRADMSRIAYQAVYGG
ncbi:DUF1127 domain-containing protein [Sagittula sp. NFXS13]|uniref:Uncharacterized protein YjiS (DUF1127 family) n=1 Tax=Sagittula marina TaxID=943940 RepID=A0A7W6DRN3_9RHOB|nr:DUF1127 domain-containing protein [Sagittula marina]MBB3985440.1 uncharacterized protein YjiS (DUF1127 family) [Sagittula marina]